MADNASNMSPTAAAVAAVAAAPLLRLAVLLGVGLTLGACSKCDVPTPWQRGSAGDIPAACHSEPAQ